MTPIIYPLPEQAIVSSPFSESRKNPFGFGYRPHYGVDLVAPGGTPVKASIEGRVTIAGWYGGYGNAVVITNDSQKTVYGHLSQVLVKKGDTVSAGATVGRVGTTGNSTGYHLHFELWVKEADRWNPKDPLKFLPKNYQGTSSEATCGGTCFGYVDLGGSGAS